MENFTFLCKGSNRLHLEQLAVISVSHVTYGVAHWIINNLEQYSTE